MKRYTLVLLAVLAGSACAGNLPPVSAVASATANVERTGLLILRAAQTAHTQTNPLTGRPLVTLPQLDAVAIQCDRLGKLGTSIAQLLDAYENAKAAKQDTAQLSAAIRAAIQSATTGLNAIGTAVPKGTVQQIDQAVTSALAVYAQIKAIAL